MQYSFLKDFDERMKHVGMYAVLFQNSMMKQTWKQYGFVKYDEQINLIFMVLMFIMEQSLKEENCTTDDISVYLDDVTEIYFEKNLTYDECRELADFIIYTILGNEGKEIWFDCMDTDAKAYKIEHIRLIANRVVYPESGVKRTSYYLTDDGYNLMLSTLEIENNMQLTIHEMIFKLQLEKQSYDKALDEVKRIFNSLRIQLQKIKESMLQIKRNALNYSVTEYKKLQTENMDTIEDTKRRFQGYRNTVMEKAKELEQQNINIKKLTDEEEEKLSSLRQIEDYLNRSIEEHQKILNSHFDLKTLYEHYLEMYSKMTNIKRFEFRSEIYERILNNPEYLNDIDIFLRPLFYNDVQKIYNPSKALELQRPIRKKADGDECDELSFDEDEYEQELERKRTEKLEKYERSLTCILEKAMERGGKIKLSELAAEINQSESNNRLKNILIPTIDIFKEIMVELISTGTVAIEELRNESKQYIQEKSHDFQLQEMLLEITDKRDDLRGIEYIYVGKVQDKPSVKFEHVMDESGTEKVIKCSEVLICLEENRNSIHAN